MFLGRGNARLIAWDGDRTLSLNMEDALLTPESFSILAAAGLTAASDSKPLYVHSTSQVEVSDTNTIILGDEDNSIIACWNGGMTAAGNSVTVPKVGTEEEDATESDAYQSEADIYVMKLTDSGEMEVEPCKPSSVTYTKKTAKNGSEYYITTITCYGDDADQPVNLKKGDIVLVDYYVKKVEDTTLQIEITPEMLSSYFYIEGSTLYRRESDGVDMPAEIVIPKGKVQSNFTVTMASTGDPSTFSFVVDTFPDYTKFDKTKKVQAVIQIVSDSTGEDEKIRENCDAKNA